MEEHRFLPDFLFAASADLLVEVIFQVASGAVELVDDIRTRLHCVGSSSVVQHEVDAARDSDFHEAMESRFLRLLVGPLVGVAVVLRLLDVHVFILFSPFDGQRVGGSVADVHFDFDAVVGDNVVELVAFCE